MPLFNRYEPDASELEPYRFTAERQRALGLQRPDRPPHDWGLVCPHHEQAARQRYSRYYGQALLNLWLTNQPYWAVRQILALTLEACAQLPQLQAIINAAELPQNRFRHEVGAGISRLFTSVYLGADAHPLGFFEQPERQAACVAVVEAVIAGWWPSSYCGPFFPELWAVLHQGCPVLELPIPEGYRLGDSVGLN